MPDIDRKLYHGCFYINENDTRKLIDYERGENCILSNKQFILARCQGKMLEKDRLSDQKEYKKVKE